MGALVHPSLPCSVSYGITMEPWALQGCSKLPSVLRGRCELGVSLSGWVVGGRKGCMGLPEQEQGPK